VISNVGDKSHGIMRIRLNTSGIIIGTGHIESESQVRQTFIKRPLNK